MISTVVSVIGVVTTILLTLLLVLFIVVNTLRGRSKGFLHSLLKIASAFIAGFLALLLARPIGHTISGVLAKPIVKAISGIFSGYDDLMSATSVINDIIVGIPGILFTVIIYIVLFILFYALLSIPIHFLKKLIFDKFPDFPDHAWAGALCGAFVGIIMFVFLLAPLAGTLSLVGDVSEMVMAVTAADGSSDTSDITEADGKSNLTMLASDIGANTLLANGATASVGNNFMVKTVCFLGGKPIYDTLTVIKVGGQSISVSKEIAVMSDVVTALSPIFDGRSPSKWTDKDIKSIKRSTEKMDDSKLVVSLVADIVSEVGEKWSDNKSFLGMKMPKVGRNSVDRFFGDLFLVLESTTEKTVSSDLGVIADILGQLQRYGVLDSTDKSDIGKDIGKDGFVSGLLEIIVKNERFKGLAASAVNLGVSETLDILNVPATDSEVYDRFVNEMANAINELGANGKTESEFRDDVCDIFESHGIKANRRVTDCVSDYFLADFKGRNDVSVDEVSAFFAIAFATDNASPANMHFVNDPFAALPLGSARYSGANALRAMLESIREQAEENGEDVDWDALATLTSREAFRSDAVKSESLRVTEEMVASLSYDELMRECKDIENILQDMIKFSESAEADGGMKKADVSALGNALNTINGSKMLGSISDDFIKATLGSDAVRGNVSISQKTLDSMVGSDGTDYKNILVSIQNTANIIDGLGNAEGNISDEELDEKLGWMLDDMSENTATVVGDIFDSKNAQKFGIPKENADKIASAVNVFFVKMAESKADTSDPNDKDMKASKALFKFISATKNSEGDLFETVGMSVSETISVFMGSHISRETMIEASYKDGELILDAFGVAGSVSDEAKQEAIEALEDETRSNYSDAQDKTEYKKAILAIGAVVGVDVSTYFPTWIR